MLGASLRVDKQKATGNMVVHLSTIANQFSVMKISSGGVSLGVAVTHLVCHNHSRTGFMVCAEVAELLTNWKKVFELANTPEDDVLVKLPAIARGPAKEEDIVKVEPTIITTRSGSRQRSAAAAAEAAALAAAAAGARSSKSAAAAGARSSKST